MPRRAASGHMPATQLLKLAAASRIALAVISGWPEAPSSPLQGGAPPGLAACGCCASPPDFGANKLLRKLETPSPEDCAAAAGGHSSAPASTSTPVRTIIVRAFSCFILTRPPKITPGLRGPDTVSNSLTKA